MLFAVLIPKCSISNFFIFLNISPISFHYWLLILSKNSFSFTIFFELCLRKLLIPDMLLDFYNEKASRCTSFIEGIFNGPSTSNPQPLELNPFKDINSNFSRPIKLSYNCSEIYELLPKVAAFSYPIINLFKLVFELAIIFGIRVKNSCGTAVVPAIISPSNPATFCSITSHNYLKGPFSSIGSSMLKLRCFNLF